MTIATANKEEFVSVETWQQALEKQVAGWHFRLHLLSAEISRFNAERGDLEEKVKATEVLLGRPPMSDINREDRPLSIREGIELLMKDGNHRSGSLIRQSLVAAGFDSSKIGPTSGAFYNALSRLTARGVLLKSENGTYRMEGVSRDKSR